MQWENVDLEEGQIDIRAKGGWRPKSHSERTVPIPKRLVELLRGHQSMVPSGPDDWVFPVPTHGGRWTVGLQPRCSQARLPGTPREVAT